jgi:hypothetical protein
MRTRSLTLAALLLYTTAAYAQDATIYYTTPTIQAGQPVQAAEPQIRTVPVYTPVPAETVVDGYSMPTPTPATDADNDYLAAPSVQVSQYDDSVRFVSGGIGGFEKSWFDTNAKDYDLKVTYADTTGHHLSGVNVTLAQGETPVLTVMTEGPYLLVEAKPGTYILTSTYQGITKTQKVTLGKGLARATVTYTDLDQ